MPPRSVPADTEPEVYDRLVEIWRAMTLLDRRALIDQLHADVEDLALAGIRAQKPGIEGLALTYELAKRRYGADVVDPAYCDLLPG